MPPSVDPTPFYTRKVEKSSTASIRFAAALADPGPATAFCSHAARADRTTGLEPQRQAAARFEGARAEGARTLVIAYGATARSARHAVKIVRQRGRKVGLLQLKTIWPFPEEVVELAARKAHRVIVPELNLGQLALEVERALGI